MEPVQISQSRRSERQTDSPSWIVLGIQSGVNLVFGSFPYKHRVMSACTLGTAGCVAVCVNPKGIGSFH